MIASRASGRRVTEDIPARAPLRVFRCAEKICSHWKSNRLEENRGLCALRFRAPEGIGYAGAAYLAGPAHL